MMAQKKDIAEILFMALVTLGSIYLFGEANKIAPPEYEVLGPAFAPRILVVAVGGFAAFLAVQKLIYLFRTEAPSAEVLDEEQQASLSLSQLRFVAILILLSAFIFVFAQKLLPYWICATLFLVLSHLVLSSGTTKQIWLSVGVSISVVAANYTLATSLFEKALN